MAFRLSDKELNKWSSILSCDNKERFLKFFRDHPDKLSMVIFWECTRFKAKKCLIAMIQGELGISPQELYMQAPPTESTPLAIVAYSFPDPDVIALLLNRGGLQHVNTKCYLYLHRAAATPLSHALRFVSVKDHIFPWIQGDSLFKLIILLCQWDTKPSLDSARMLAPLTDSINDIAWTFLRDGDFIPFAALLLVSREKALLPFDSGLTIRQYITDTITALKTEGGHEGAEYMSMLMDACKLLDIFERAGDNLSLYCSSMHKYVAPDKVLIDVNGILKKADFRLQPVDIDLRDCFRGCVRLWNANLFKQSDLPNPKSKLVSVACQTSAHGSGAALRKIPYAKTYLHFKLKSGSMLRFTSSGSVPRLLSTAAGQVDKGVSDVAWKNLAYAALKLKRGMRF